MKRPNLLKKTQTITFIAAISILIILKAEGQKPAINEAEFRDKVYACWLGKNIGGTLGMPFEGKKELNNLTFYTNIKPGEPAANDDLDLQILWLKAMEENNYRVDAYTLGEYWLKYIPVNWNEYGVGKANMNLGIMPPLSGEYNNAKWKTSNGAWIRSEIWACLAPGNPLLAAQFAWEDASVDHGCTEGTLAEIFTATLESAAFIEKDRDKLIQFALTMIPSDSRVAAAVNAAVEAKKKGMDWKQARETVIKVTEDLGWFQAPRNVAFTIIGWLYGEDDFGKSICIAVNCGDDTDCTGATLGSIFGIIYGTKIIPDNWKAPIGDGIKTVAISGFEAPATLQILTDKTIAAQKKVAELYKSPFTVTSGSTVNPKSYRLPDANKNELFEIWNRSPYQIKRSNEELTFVCDYSGDPEIKSGEARVLKFSVVNKTNKEKNISLKITKTPVDYSIKGLPEGTVKISPHGKYEVSVSATALPNAVNAKFIVEITDESKTLPIQLGIVKVSKPYPAINDTIAKYRKGELIIKAKAGDKVSVEQLSHEFWFGCAIANSLADGRMKENDLVKYKENFLKNFNSAVTENAVKWGTMEPRKGEVNYSVIDGILKWTDENHIPLRGHNLFWGVPNFVQPWVKELNDTELKAALQNRAETVTSRYKGRFVEYDLNNEMVHGNYYEDRLGGDITKLMAQWAHNGDPEAKLFLNDYDILTGKKLPEYMAQIRKLLKQGVPIAGIGVQGHLHSETFDRDQLRSALDSLSIFKLPVRITEFNMPGQRSRFYSDRNLKMTAQEEEINAKEIAEYYRICFSHPAVQGIIMWGFWEGANWIPVSSLYRRDWSPTPSARAYQNLLFKEWWTKVSGTANSEETYTTPAFYGKYKIIVNGVSKEVDLKKKKGKVIVDFR